MRPVKAAGALHRAMVNREDYCVTLIGSEHFDAGLAARLLFRENKFAAFKISSMLAQKEGDLKREENLAVQILMQAVEVTGTVLEDQRRRASLARGVTLLGERRKVFRITRLLAAESMEPLIRKRR